MLSNLVPIRSIEADDIDFSDLAPLAAAIGAARVVGLGEARHGDGHAYKAKVRLAKFLHLEMGFDVLAWESGLFACREMDRALRDDGAPLPLDRGVFRMWRQAEEVRPLFDHARASHRNGRPLEMTGFDCQVSDGRSGPLLDALFDFVDGVDPALVGADLRAHVRALIDRLDRTDPPYDPTPEERMRSRAAVDTLVEILMSNRRRFAETHGQRELGFWHEVLGGLLELERDRAMWPAVEGRAISAGQVIACLNARDASMARTVQWMVDDYYAGRKIMLWAASFHLCANHAELGFGPDIPGFATGWPPEVRLSDDFLDPRYQYPMGEYLRRHLGDAYYTIGCTTYAGERGDHYEPPATIQPAVEGSAEEVFHRSGMDYGFLDLRGLRSGHRLRSPVVARPLGHGQQPAVWPRHLDALLFVDRGFPATRAASRRADQGRFSHH